MDTPVHNIFCNVNVKRTVQCHMAKKKNLVKVAVVCSAGWKQPTQNIISSVHSSQPKHQFPYYICHWDFSFPLVCENSFKGLLTSLSNKRVTVINGVGYRGKKIPARLCAAVICLWLYRACLDLSSNMKVEGKYEPQLQRESFSGLSEERTSH